MATKRPKKNLSLEEKYKIIKLNDANVKRKDIMEEFNITHPRRDCLPMWTSSNRTVTEGKIDELEQEVT